MIKSWKWLNDWLFWVGLKFEDGTRVKSLCAWSWDADHVGLRGPFITACSFNLMYSLREKKNTDEKVHIVRHLLVISCNYFPLPHAICQWYFYLLGADITVHSASFRKRTVVLSFSKQTWCVLVYQLHINSQNNMLSHYFIYLGNLFLLHYFIIHAPAEHFKNEWKVVNLIWKNIFIVIKGHKTK